VTTLLRAAKAPEALRVILTPGTTGLDMRSVSSCTLNVTRPDRTTTTWDTVLTDAGQYSVTARHVFDAGGDETALPGAYIIEPIILVPGSRRCRLFKLHVVQYPTP
jgi:hypothetical protein